MLPRAVNLDSSFNLKFLFFEFLNYRKFDNLHSETSRLAYLLIINLMAGNISARFQSLRQCFSLWMNFLPRGHLTKSGDSFGCHNQREEIVGRNQGWC